MSIVIWNSEGTPEYSACCILVMSNEDRQDFDELLKEGLIPTPKAAYRCSPDSLENNIELFFHFAKHKHKIDATEPLPSVDIEKKFNRLCQSTDPKLVPPLMEDIPPCLWRTQACLKLVLELYQLNSFISANFLFERSSESEFTWNWWDDISCFKQKVSKLNAKFSYEPVLSELQFGSQVTDYLKTIHLYFEKLEKNQIDPFLFASAISFSMSLHSKDNLDYCKSIALLHRSLDLAMLSYCCSTQPVLATKSQHGPSYTGEYSLEMVTPTNSLRVIQNSRSLRLTTAHVNLINKLNRCRNSSVLAHSMNSPSLNLLNDLNEGVHEVCGLLTSQGQWSTILSTVRKVPRLTPSLLFEFCPDFTDIFVKFYPD